MANIRPAHPDKTAIKTTIPAVGSVIIGTLYALLDGAIGGLVFAWLYNLCASRK